MALDFGSFIVSELVPPFASDDKLTFDLIFWRELRRKYLNELF